MANSQQVGRRNTACGLRDLSDDRISPMKRRKPWLDYLAYVAVRSVAMVLAMFPIEANRRLMHRLGRIWFDLPQRLPVARVPGWMAGLPVIGRRITRLVA